MTDYVFKGNRILFESKKIQTKVLNEIVDVVEKESPDLFLYTEVLLGSFRNQNLNQHLYIAGELQYEFNGALGKYGEGMLEKLPLHKGNANGYCSASEIESEPFYTESGTKKLVYKINIKGTTVFVAHLSLKSNVRQEQLLELAERINSISGPVVVCGDMNIMNGLGELKEFQEMTNLEICVNPPLTFPSYRPLKTLDLFLYRDIENAVSKTYTIQSKISDHLPVVLQI